MKIEESIIINSTPEDVFAFLAVRDNDLAWMSRWWSLNGWTPPQPSPGSPRPDGDEVLRTTVGVHRRGDRVRARQVDRPSDGRRTAPARHGLPLRACSGRLPHDSRRRGGAVCRQAGRPAGRQAHAPRIQGGSDEAQALRWTPRPTCDRPSSAEMTETRILVKQPTISVGHPKPSVPRQARRADRLQARRQASARPRRAGQVDAGCA